MDPQDIVGVLAFVIAAGGLLWQILSQRVRLRVEIDGAKSEFFTSEMQTHAGHGENEPPAERCTVICLALAIANVSTRSNKIERIEVRVPAARPVELVRARVAARPQHAWDGTERLPYWKTPHPLPPGDRHEAWSRHVLRDGVWGNDAPMKIRVRVVDAYGRAHGCRAELRHRAPKRP